ncbi:MAG: efflux RND transporter periplasmic adaptor subunit [Lactimicrobium massiliense]|nr:HlyD family efflux transporter periplasmic adaptor subunit [Lactimicrobium massiliense]MDD6230051.1 efflux RND transporter periplasmic adaptor subunit [Lactimicrobium massiliense]
MKKMGKKKRGIIFAVAVVAVAAVIVVLVRGFSSGSSSDGGNVVYVQKVSDLTGMTSSLNPSQRFSGVAQAQESVDIKADSSRKIDQIFVSEGQSVKKDDQLFSYQTDDLQNTIDNDNLSIESLSNDISALNEEIADLNSQMQSAAQNDKFQYTTQIQAKQMQIRQDQLDIQTKQNEIKHTQQEIDQSVVKSAIDGVVKAINDTSATNSDGSTKPLMTISKTGDLRIKGTVDEQSIGILYEGLSVIVRSRVDESEIWQGTITSVDSEPASSDSSTIMYGYSSSSDNQASRYTFYASLDNGTGLMLGQHVYIEPAGSAAVARDGIWINQAFIVTDEDGTSYVWADHNGRLVKQKVEIGQTDDSDGTVEIVSGLKQEDGIAYPDDTLQEGQKTAYVTMTGGMS